MKTYIVTYDLCRPGQNYTSLLSSLAAMPGAVHYQQSAWLVRHRGDAVVLRDQLRTLMDRNDKLFVAEVTIDAAWLVANVAANGAMTNVFRRAA